MIRTQVRLTEEQAKRLRQRAAAEGRSLADLIRQGVDTLLANGGPDSKDLRRRALQVVGRYSSGKSDVSAKHDKYLTETFGG